MTRWFKSGWFVIAALLAMAATAQETASVVRVRLIAINDLHGHLEPGENTIEVRDPRDAARTVRLRVGGASHLATLIERLRAEQPNAVVVSSGDLIGASPLISGLFRDEPTIEVMNAIGLDVHGLGNHEFDRGIAELQRIARGGCARDGTDHRQTCQRGFYSGARFPFVAANVFDRNSGGSAFEPAVVKTVAGIRIGFIGAVTRATPGIVVPSGVAGLRFTSESAALNEQARRLQADGVRAIVAVVHEGGDTDGAFDECVNPRGAIFDIERRLDRAIDVVLSAHTHRGYNCTVATRPVIQGASFGRLVSVVDLAIDRTSGAVIAAQTRARNLPVPNGAERDARLAAAYPPLPEHPAVAAIVEHYRAAAAPLAERPAGRISAPFERFPGPGGDHPLGRLIADAQLAATRSNGAQIAFTNPGGIRTALRARGPDGAVTYADAYGAQPFGNSLVTMTLTGAEVKQLLEQQWSATRERARILQPSAGFSYRWHDRRPVGDRVDAIALNGQPLPAGDRVRVTVNSFLAAGGDGFRVLRDGRDRVGGPLDIDAFTEYLRAQSAAAPLAPSSLPRIRRAE